VKEGEKLTIVRPGHSVARLPSLYPLRWLGWLAGVLIAPDDFDESLPEELLTVCEGRG